MNVLLQDLRYAVRLLARQPGFTTVVVLSLALGIGANTLIFTVVHAVLIRSLPYREPDRIAMLWFKPPKRPNATEGATVANYLALREQARVFEHVGAMQWGIAMNISGDSSDATSAEQLHGQKLSPALAQALGVSPFMGRWYTEEEDRFGADPVMVISYPLWQRRFGSAPDVLGKTVRMDGQLTTIVGVMPDGFAFFNEEAEFWTPLALSPFVLRSPTRYLDVVVRLKLGMTLSQAQAEMNSIAAGLAAAFPDTNKGWGIRLEPLHEAYVGWLREPMLLLQGVVAFVLLIACANVAGLLLAQAAARRKEVTVRVALGSSRWRVVRQFLTESVLLSLVGGALGVALAWAGLRLFVALSPAWFPRLKEIALDSQVLGFTIGLSVATGLVFGAVPALQVSRPDLMDALKEATRGATTTAVRQRLRSALVVLEMSLALVLLIGAGLLINSFVRLYGAQPGCDPRNLVTFQIRLSRGEFAKNVGVVGGYQAVEISPQVNAIFEQIRERLAGLPGVQAVAAGTTPPLAGWNMRFNFTIEGRKPPSSEQEVLSAASFAVSPGYFQTLRVPLLRGRDFGAQDPAAGTPVAIISETMAQRFWRDENPIGKRIQIGLVNDPLREIVGVVGDVRQNRYQPQTPAQVYVPYVQQPLGTQGRLAESRLTMTYVIRAASDPTRLVPTLRSAVAEIDRKQPVFNVKTVDQYVSEQLQQPRQYVTLLSIFGGISVILAVVGVYGIVAYSVSQRTHEIGIRMALGAASGDVLRLMIRQGLLLIALGTALGLTASLALTRLLKSLLWGVATTDPATFALVVLALVMVALAACYLPVHRALRIDPMAALRYE